jgi:hypothetical protein
MLMAHTKLSNACLTHNKHAKDLVRAPNQCGAAQLQWL